MKTDLLALINQVDEIQNYFHNNTIYDVPEFSIWVQELQSELEELHARTRDKFIWGALVKSKQGFSGWHDKTSYNELKGKLYAIRKKVDSYYPMELENKEGKDEVSTMTQKPPKIFISHSSEDSAIVTTFVEFLEDIGLKADQIFCSSVPGYGIPLDEDIYTSLKDEFTHFSLHVILFLSENYYSSVASLNEMGAAWALQSKYTIVLLPGYEFVEIKGAINPRQIALKLDNPINDVKAKLGQLRDGLIGEFDLARIPEIRWEKKRDTFIEAVVEKKA